MKKQSKEIILNSQALRSAKLLYTLIKKNNPSWWVNPNWSVWSSDIEKLHRIDGRSYEQINWMISWVQQNEFWKINILSPYKLRQKFNDLIPRASADVKKKQKNKCIVI